MIDWSTVTEVIDGLLWLCGGLIVVGAIFSGLAAKDSGDC